MCIVPVTYRCSSTGHITLSEYESRIYPYPSGNACACPTILYDRSGQTQDYDCPTCEAVQQRWKNRELVLSMVGGSSGMAGGVPGMLPVQRPPDINNGRNTAIQAYEIVGLGEETEKKREKRKAEEEALRVYGTKMGSSFQSNPAVSKRRRTPYPVPASMGGGGEQIGEQGGEKERENGADEPVNVSHATPAEGLYLEGETEVKIGDAILVETDASDGDGGTGVEDEDDQSMFVPE